MSDLIQMQREIEQLRRQLERLSAGEFVTGTDWTSYACSWTCTTGTSPVLGNGTLGAYYVRMGSLVTVSIDLVMGSTTTYGDNDWFFSLPVIAAVPAVGPVYMLDSGSGYFTGVCIPVGSNNGIRVFYRSSSATPSSSVARFDRPFTWAANDRLSLSITYMA